MKKKWHVTGDTWYVTRDTWHVTRDMWQVTHDTGCGVNILSKFQLSRSNRLGFTMLWISGGKSSLTELMNDEAVYRTAPATPGLLTTQKKDGPNLDRQINPKKIWNNELRVTTKFVLGLPRGKQEDLEHAKKNLGCVSAGSQAPPPSV